MSPLVRWIALFILVFGTFFIISNDQKVKDQIQTITDKLTGEISGIKNKLSDVYPNRSCDEPLAYTLGEIDGRFGLSESQIVNLLKEAESIWENTSGQDLFQYSPSDPDAVRVNFIFDERQADILAAKQSENSLDNKWAQFEKLVDQYEALSSEHNQSLATYESDVAEYESLLDKFNKSVDDWNKNGGSQKEYQELKDDEHFIKVVFQGLEKEQDKINNNADSINALADKIEILQKELSRQTDIHNSNFGESEVINSGDFDTYAVNVYQYYSIPDLRLTLAHELAHALGLDHVSNEESIMYYLLDKQDVLNLEPSVDDLAELRIVCK